MAGRIDDVPRVEHAMDAALMLATVATRLGDRYGLVVFDAAVRTVLEPSKSRSQVGRVTEALFDLEPELVETDYRGAFADGSRAYQVVAFASPTRFAQMREELSGIVRSFRLRCATAN